MADLFKPIRLTAPERDRFKTFLKEEVEAVLSGRQAMEQEWRQSIEDYEAGPFQGRKDFPFEGACAINIPTIGTTVDAIFAREMNTVFALRPLWTVNPTNKRWVNHSKPTENFLEWAQQHVMSMYDVCWDWYLETTKLGTGFIKSPWIEDVRRQLGYGSDGRLGFHDNVYHYGPKPQYIPIQDMLLPDGDWEVQTAPWIGNKFRLTTNQLKVRKKAPYYYEDVDKIEPLDMKDIIREKRDQLEGFQRIRPFQQHELMEIWADYDVNGDDYDEPLVATWDHRSETLCRIIYNPYIESHRPYHKACFMRREGRAYGLGVARMLRQIADGITTQFRQFIDNATIANTRIWKARRGAGVKPGTKLYAGKVVFLQDPKNDLVGEQMGDIYNSQLSVLGSLREAGERRTGLSDVHLGIESPRVVNRMPATNMLSLLQEGNKRFDLTIRDLRHATARVAESALLLYQQFRPTGMAYDVLGDDGQLVEEVWRFPRARFRGNLSITVTATSQASNRELEKQSLNQLMQALTGFYDMLMKHSVVMLNPQMPSEAKELSMKVVAGQSEMVRRLLQAYAVPDTESFVPNFDRIFQNGGRNNGGAAGGTGAQPIRPGMGGLLSIPGMVGAGRMAGGGPSAAVAGGNRQLPIMGGVQGAPREIPGG